MKKNICLGISKCTCSKCRRKRRLTPDQQEESESYSQGYYGNSSFEGDPMELVGD